MKTCCSYGEEAVLAFRVEDDEQARAMIDDHEGNLRSDLKVLVRFRSRIHARTTYWATGVDSFNVKR
jgi:hypothetical protein